MLIKLLDLITVEDATGEEYDIGELVTYLNDAVLIAPSMLLAPDVSWAPVDASSFDVSLVDHEPHCADLMPSTSPQPLFGMDAQCPRQ